MVGNHLVEWRSDKRNSFVLCRYLLIGKDKRPSFSNIWCTLCDAPLCCNNSRNCFKIYHEKQNINLNED